MKAGIQYTARTHSRKPYRFVDPKRKKTLDSANDPRANEEQGIVCMFFFFELYLEHHCWQDEIDIVNCDDRKNMRNFRVKKILKYFF